MSLQVRTIESELNTYTDFGILADLCYRSILREYFVKSIVSHWCDLISVQYIPV